jgi:hypothetical protein
VKFELGSLATPWVALSPQQQLAACQRFFQVGRVDFQANASAGGWTRVRQGGSASDYASIA